MPLNGSLPLHHADAHWSLHGSYTHDITATVSAWNVVEYIFDKATPFQIPQRAKEWSANTVGLYQVVLLLVTPLHLRTERDLPVRSSMAALLNRYYNKCHHSCRLQRIIFLAYPRRTLRMTRFRPEWTNRS
jgi:hypothetical protein